MERIHTKKSFRNGGYCYFYEEDTKFIVYQKSDDTIIVGFVNHGDEIKEEEIEKIYEMSIKNIGLYPIEKNSVTLERTIFAKNIKEKFDDSKTMKFINKFVSSWKLGISLNQDFLKENEKIKYSDIISLDSLEEEYYSQVCDILDWMYDIGIRSSYRSDCDSNEYYEDTYFHSIKERMDGFFTAYNNTLRVTDGTYLSDEMVDKAYQENEVINTCIKNIKNYLIAVNDILYELNYREKFKQAFSEDELEKVSKCFTKYKKITGRQYNVIKAIEEIGK